MGKSSDWMPTSQNAIRSMCQSWLNYANVHKERMEIPESQIGVLGNAFKEFMKLFMMRVEEKTSTTSTQLGIKTEELITTMREFKRKSLTQPPLRDNDFAGLQLKIPDGEPTSAGVPVGLAEADISYPGAQQLLLSLKHVDGTQADSKADYGFKISYQLFCAGETYPVSGEDLKYIQVTRQKKFLFRFSQEDSGKRAYFCIRYENAKGEAGSCGPLFYALVP